MGTRTIYECPEDATSREVLERTHKTYQAFSFLELAREEDDPTEKPTCGFVKYDNGKSVREELVVDSGAVECVTSRKRMPRLTVDAQIKDEVRHGHVQAEMRSRKECGDSQFAHRCWRCRARQFKVGPASRKNIDHCGQTSRNRS